MAVWNSTSGATKNWPTISRPTMAPSRPRRVLWASCSERHTMKGTNGWEIMFVCPVACDTRPGANPQKKPAIHAANGEATTLRHSQYQAAAVAARQNTSTTAKVTGVPKARVIGEKRAPHASIEVLASRFTPSGTFMAWVTNGFDPCTMACAVWAYIHSNTAWSLSPPATRRCCMSCSRLCST